MNTRIGRTKEAKARKALMPDAQFFFNNAGYSYKQGESPLNGKIRCAIALELAERAAREMGLSFEWDYDEAGCSGCDCDDSSCKCSTGEPHETLYCLVRWPNDKRVLASLGGICGATSEYRRVVEAELAEEAIDSIRSDGARVNA